VCWRRFLLFLELCGAWVGVTVFFVVCWGFFVLWGLGIYVRCRVFKLVTWRGARG